MALVTKIDPTGVDVPIDNLQKYIWQKMSWSNFRYTSYPRAYKTETNDGNTYEVFVNGKEYREVLYDDRVDVSTFFVADENLTKVNNQVYKTTIRLIVQINLSACYPDIPHRADEEATMELLKVLDVNYWKYKVLNVRKGIRNVFRDINVNGILFTDMQPFHIFSVEMEVEPCRCVGVKTPQNIFDNTFDITFS